MRKSKFLYILLLIQFCIPVSAFSAAGNGVDTGNTAWIMISSTLVMLMTPGLAFFYAGMVSRKNVISTLLQSFVCMAIVGIIWVTFGYSLVFTKGSGFIGNFDLFMLDGLQNTTVPGTGVPLYAFVTFQLMFATITPAIITGSIAERVRFESWIIFLVMWTICVYLPIAHWVWGPNGWIAQDGGLDFAGGLVVHIAAGVAGLVAALMFGKRTQISCAEKSSDVSMVLLGGSILWFGWFGFNTGSALIAGQTASASLINTHLGACSAFIAWMVTDYLMSKKPSAVSATMGFIVGLVTITPAAGYVSLQSAILMCAISGVLCNFTAAMLKRSTKLDDTLDVFACHGLSGIIGSILLGLFAESSINKSVVNQGMLIDGSLDLLRANTEATIIVGIYSALITYLLITGINKILPMRISKEEEQKGLDASLQDEILEFYKESDKKDS